MLDTLNLTSSWSTLRQFVLERVDQPTRQALAQSNVTAEILRLILSTARFSPPLPVYTAGTALPDGNIMPDTKLQPKLRFQNMMADWRHHRLLLANLYSWVRPLILAAPIARLSVAGVHFLNVMASLLYLRGVKTLQPT